MLPQYVFQLPYFIGCFFVIAFYSVFFIQYVEYRRGFHMHDETERSVLKDMLGLGCWAFGGDYWSGQSHQDSIRVIHKALRSGIRHFDTAQVYGNGRSEQITGQQLKRFKEIPRDELQISTKILMPPDELFAADGSVKDTSALEVFIRDRVRVSLSRLCTDYIDTLFIHWPRSGADPRAVVEVFETLRSEGKLRHIGVSNFPADLMAQASEAGRIDACQTAYSLFWTQPDAEIIPFCRKHAIRTEAYSPLAQGILAAKFPAEPQFSDSDRRGGLVFFQPQVWKQLYPLTLELSDIARELSVLSSRQKKTAAGTNGSEAAESPAVSPAMTAIAWLLAGSRVDKVLIGARTKIQLEELLESAAAAALLKETPELLKRLDAIAERARASMPPDCDNIFRNSW